MRPALVIGALSAMAVSGCGGAPGEEGSNPDQEATEALDPPSDACGVVWTRDASARLASERRRGGPSPNMIYHGGKIMTGAVIEAIFWGTSWGSYSGDKITGIDSFYTGYNGSNYAGTVTEYTGTNGQVGKTTRYLGNVVDTSVAVGGSNSSRILAEVCKVINNTPDPSGDGFYAVYTDVPRGSAGYCAWHASGTCTPGGTVLEFAFFFNLDGDPGCDPRDTSGKHSQGLAAIANVSGHELSEARTDPSTTTATGFGAWYDASGEEDGDKCAWTWGAPLITFSNGSVWKVQGEWSNAAYNAGTGYANASGQKGCLSGL